MVNVCKAPPLKRTPTMISAVFSQSHIFYQQPNHAFALAIGRFFIVPQAGEVRRQRHNPSAAFFVHHGAIGFGLLFVLLLSLG